MADSPKYSLNEIDWQKILIGAGVAVAGTLLTYITQIVTNLQPGPWTPVIVAGWSVVANIVRKYIAGK
jgi:hypothetical protein